MGKSSVVHATTQSVNKCLKVTLCITDLTINSLTSNALISYHPPPHIAPQT